MMRVPLIPCPETTLGSLWLSLCLSVLVSGQNVDRSQFPISDGSRRLSSVQETVHLGPDMKRLLLRQGLLAVDA